MCLVTTQKAEIIAESNIVVSKELNYGTFLTYSLHTDYVYWRGRQKKISFGISRPWSGDILNINQGYHSFRDLDRGNAVFVIPKGAAIYYDDHYNEVVSNEIIYVGKKGKKSTERRLKKYL